ncbi:hypothetical protein QSM_2096 [Clostridioides difficile P30]|nr:hypothetical protein QOO_2134 [Clostridioides difficile Y165]EQK87900.1 hypothetical protein QSM_2096 [Clostridioides difficile P30]
MTYKDNFLLVELLLQICCHLMDVLQNTLRAHGLQNCCRIVRKVCFAYVSLIPVHHSKIIFPLILVQM